MNIWHISDTHCRHKELIIPDLEKIDLIIHTGDASDSKNTTDNLFEMFSFLDWYKELANKKPCMFIPGNHETAIEAGLVKQSDFGNIIYLENEIYTHRHNGKSYTIGAWSYTRKFHNWAFNVENSKLRTAHKMLAGCDIVLSHGPPLGHLDSYTDGGELLRIGCPYLLPVLGATRYFLCGHVHNHKYYNIVNAGVLKTEKYLVSNAACVNDGDSTIIHNGNFITVE